MLNKKVLKPFFMVLLICTVFTVGLHFSEDVSAAKWKKYDNGKYTDSYPPAGYTKVGKYQSYTNGENKLYVNFYNFKKGTGKKHLAAKWTLTKKKGVVKFVESNDYSKKYVSYFKTPLSVKKFYKLTNKASLKLLKISPEKEAFDKRSFNINGTQLKLYAISYNINHIAVYGYINKEEALTIGLTKNNGKITIEMYNEKRKRTYKDSLKSNLSLKKMYNIFIEEFMKEFSNKKLVLNTRKAVVT